MYSDDSLIDINMPVMDGVEATQALIELGVKNPIVAMTANAMAQDKDRCISAGIAGCVSKPFKCHELIRCLMMRLPETSG